jgi:hypothetical protein
MGTALNNAHQEAAHVPIRYAESEAEMNRRLAREMDPFMQALSGDNCRANAKGEQELHSVHELELIQDQYE